MNSGLPSRVLLDMNSVRVSTGVALTIYCGTTSKEVGWVEAFGFDKALKAAIRKAKTFNEDFEGYYGPNYYVIHEGKRIPV